jgi:curved DNA-binding protein CbpA
MAARTTFIDYYEVLGLDYEAIRADDDDESTIKAAYRKAAKDCHPDTHPDDPEAEARFKLISVAYEVLSDDVKRGVYNYDYATVMRRREGQRRRPQKEREQTANANGHHGEDEQTEPDEPDVEDVPLPDMDEATFRAVMSENEACARCQTPDYTPDADYPGVCSGCRTERDDEAVETWAADHGADLLDRMRDHLKAHFVMPRAEFFDVWAMFCLHTHVFEARRHTLYLTLMSPTKGCGKSDFLEVASFMCHEGHVDNDPVAIATAEFIASQRPTLLLDEIDGIWHTSGRNNEQLRRILNLGFNKRIGFITRRRKGGVQRINCFSPKVLAGIEDYSIPPTIRDRSIETTIFLATKDEQAALTTVTDATHEEGGILGVWGSLWAKAHMDAVARRHPKQPEHLYGREWDKWSLLYALAELVGGHWLDTVDAAYQALKPDDEEDSKVVLLRDVQTVFAAKKGAAWLESQAIVDALNNMEDREWSYYGGRGLTPHMLAKLMKGWGVKPKLKNDGRDRGRRGYLKAAFVPLWERWLNA